LAILNQFTFRIKHFIFYLLMLFCGNFKRTVVMSLVGMLVLRHILNRSEEKYSLLALIALMFTLSFAKTLCLDVGALTAREYKTGVKPGDWIEYEINWTSPPSWAYPARTRREILDVEGTIITVTTTQELSNGTVTKETKEGDVAKGTGASAMIFIPANLEVGDWINIEGFDDVSITGENTQVYLGIERTVLYANFSSKGFDILIFWDKEKGTALEIHSSSIYTSTVKVIKTNLWGSESFDNNYLLGFGTLVLIIIISAALIMRNRHMRSKRRKRIRK